MMKNLVYAFLIVIASSTIGHAQSIEKIKGNRTVTLKQTYIDDFQSLVINGDFDIEIVFNSTPSVQIEADNNLHDVINFEVLEGVLSISASKRITSKKKLLITVNYGSLLNNIEVNSGSEIRSLTSMELGDFALKITGNSRAYLNLKATNFQFNASGKSKSRLNINADTTTFELSDDSQIDALINSKISKFDLYQRADAKIEGAVENLELRLVNSCNFFGKNYTSKNTMLLIEDNSDANVSASETIIIEASGNTEVYLYGEPQIELKTFTGSAKLQKKSVN